MLLEELIIKNKTVLTLSKSDKNLKAIKTIDYRTINSLHNKISIYFNKMCFLE